MKSSLKDRWFNILMITIFIIGVAIVAYPTVSDYWNSKVQSKAISDYKKTVENTSNYQLEKLKLEAKTYNQALYESQVFASVMPDNISDYEDVLNINGDGIMGYLIIPVIDVELPIYHGTEEKTLQVAAGHSQVSSLPCGGENTHSVILGHRGLPSARLFNDLDQLEEGDYFEIHILDETLVYEVYETLIVEPQELANLRIKSGEDKVTLVTCTPYGINTHRLLVEARRVYETDENKLIFTEAKRINRAYVAIAAGIVLWTISIFMLIYFSSKHRSRKISHDEYLRRRGILDKYQK